MATETTLQLPLERRDFRQGRITPRVIANSLVPTNSVKESFNVNFDEVVGSAKVRAGTTVLGSEFETVGNMPTGLAEFVPSEGGVGADLVTNGTFTGSATGWTLGNGWVYGTNNVTWSLLGSELTTNGTFTGSSAPWSLGSGWAYGTNNVTASGTIGTISQTISFTPGNTYRLGYTISGSNSNSMFANIGDSLVGANRVTASTTDGSHTVEIVAGSNNTSVILGRVSPAPSFNGTLDSVSVKQYNQGGVLSQNITAVDGITYQVSLVVGGTTGFVTVALGLNSFNTPAGTTATLNLIATSPTLTITPSDDFDGTIDSVSVNQVFNRLLLAVYNGDTQASLWAYDGTNWNLSNLTALSNYYRNRFTTLGGYEFVSNSSDGMYSSPDGTTWSSGAAANCIDSTDAKPSLLYRYKQRLLAAGDPTVPDRIFFSSIIDPTSTPFITWNTDSNTGDWIDVNPDDGGNITGFSENSTFLLVFKDTGMYRMDTVSKTVDPDNIYNIGAVSQEAIVLCMGVTYFFSGTGIYRTNGGYPEQISRAAVQDIIQALTPSQWENVRAGTDGLNIYFEMGSVTLNYRQSGQRTIDNLVLKFSPRDQSWSVHYYRDYFGYFAQYTDNYGSLMRAASDAGSVQTINLGTRDGGTDGAAIPFYLETQDEDFGNRSHTKSISNMIAVYADNGLTSTFSAKQNGTNLKSIIMSLQQRVNVGKNINITGNYFNFVWSGTSSNQPPILEGYRIEDAQDQGIGDAYGVPDALPDRSVLIE